MKTVVPGLPRGGEKELTKGPGPSTVKGAGLLLVPYRVETLMKPLVAPAGTRAVIWVPAEFGFPGVLVPLNFKASRLVRCTPEIVIKSLLAPYPGVTPEM